DFSSHYPGARCEDLSDIELRISRLGLADFSLDDPAGRDWKSSFHKLPDSIRDICARRYLACGVQDASGFESTYPDATRNKVHRSLRLNLSGGDARGVGRS